MGLLGGDPLLDCDLEESSEFEFWFAAEAATSSGDFTRLPCSSTPSPPPPPPPSLSLTSAPSPPSALFTSWSAFPAAGAGLPTLLSAPPFPPPLVGLGLLDFLEVGLLDRDPLRDLGFSRVVGDRDLDRERGDAVLEATLATFLFLSWNRLVELFFRLFELLLSVFRSLASSACIDLSLSDISVT